MRIGAVFPQTEIGADPAEVRAWAIGVERLGFTHMLTYDHVLGAGTGSRPDWAGPYTSETMFHEVFVLLGYVAAVTSTLELTTGVLILPQRQTALVAKQAAEVDVLSGGRLRLGVGVGWNPVEYEGLNESFGNRGARSEEQIEVLRALWRDQVITYQGRWHTITDAGLNPLPGRRIPIWLGGGADATLRRAGRIGDGWLPQGPPDDTAKEMLDRVWEYAAEAGRPREEIGIEARLTLAQTPRAEWSGYVDRWRDLGATHLCVSTMRTGLSGAEEHLAALAEVRELIA
jgi:probable F420-dependent oxidoreductase